MTDNHTADVIPLNPRDRLVLHLARRVATHAAAAITAQQAAGENEAAIDRDEESR